MAHIKVWAPQRKHVELLLIGRTLPMQCNDRGWWSIDSSDISPEADYHFRVDQKETFPDPRSKFQPEGVAGPSRIVDFEQFNWHDHGFQAPPLSSAVIYEMHVGTFSPSGTFDGAIEKLPHLRRLGITHLEIMPVAEFLGTRGWGYDGVFPYAPHHGYGGPTGLNRLVDACHQEGLAVILDVVYNHLGPAGNCLPQFAPYFTDRYHTPWGSALNFDGPHSDEVCRYFIDNAKMWLRDYHFDALRLDAVHAIIDTSAYPFLEQLASEIRQLESQLARHLALIAESDLNDPRIVRSPEHGGFGFQAQWADDFHHALHTTITGEKHGYYSDFEGIKHLATSCQQPYVYDGQFSTSRKRSHGRPIHDLPASSFVTYAQNHDQVGNRAAGERLSHLVGHDNAKIAAALYILSPYVPMLFQGEEWGAASPFQYFVDFSDDPPLAKAVTEGRRKEFREFDWNPEDVPDPQNGAAFQRSKLNWDEIKTAPHREMLDWYKALIKLRRQRPALADRRLQSVQTSIEANLKCLTVRRGDLLLIANFGDTPYTMPCVENYLILLKSKEQTVLNGSQLRLPPHSIVVAEAIANPIAIQAERPANTPPAAEKRILAAGS